MINTALRSAKGLAYSEMENKIREATNNDPWGPSGSQMLEICGFTYCRGEAYADPLALLWRRLMTPEQPRHTQKVNSFVFPGLLLNLSQLICKFMIFFILSTLSLCHHF